MDLGRNISYECLLSRSVSVLASFKCIQSVMVRFQEKCLMKNNISFKKGTQNECYYKWNGWYILLSSSGRKKFCARFYHAPSMLLTFEGHQILHMKRLCSNTLKKGDLKVYISQKENKLACFANSSGTRCRSWFLKKVSQVSCFFNVWYTPYI